MLPISMDAIATAATAPSQTSLAGENAVIITRSRVARAIVFVAVAMNAMTAVGAPSYTSGVHMWNGAAEALNASPVTTSAMPNSRMPVCEIPELSAVPIWSKRREPVAM